MPELPDLARLPDSTELPDLPELPDAAELPDSAELPELMDSAELPDPAEQPDAAEQSVRRPAPWDWGQRESGLDPMRAAAPAMEAPESAAGSHPASGSPGAYADPFQTEPALDSPESAAWG